jgi:uncharacterized protein YcfJ
MKDFKTTLTGAIVGAALVGLQLYQTGTTDVKTIATAVGIALLGYLAKDSNNSKPLNPTGATT